MPVEKSFDDVFFGEWLDAIVFYQKNGFEIIGFDLYSYSNTDPEKHEIRIEMGRKLV